MKTLKLGTLSNLRHVVEAAGAEGDEDAVDEVDVDAKEARLMLPKAEKLRRELE